MRTGKIKSKKLEKHPAPVLLHNESDVKSPKNEYKDRQ
jgi:hypothetical protein